ncbi:MAG: hypothetical protein ACLP8S_01130 [Solirubrobacteraceae bacterium]
MRSRSATAIASGALLALIVIAGIVIAITHAAGGNSSTSRHTSTTPRVIIGGSSGTTCSLPTAPQTIPADSPPAAEWQPVGAMEVPQAPTTYGPQHTNGVWNTCFAHNPSGALLAAMNFYASATMRGISPTQFLDHLATDVPTGQVKAGKPFPAGTQVAGYRYDNYTPALARVTIALQGPSGIYVAAITSLAWTGSDWRFVYPAAGGSVAAEVLPDLTGYVVWSAF